MLSFNVATARVLNGGWIGSLVRCRVWEGRSSLIKFPDKAMPEKPPVRAKDIQKTTL